MSSSSGRLAGEAPRLRLIASPRVTPASLYDETIAEVWVLALALHDGDPVRTADAVTAAYARAWAGGSPSRTTVLRAVVESAPARRRTGNVAPLIGRGRVRRPVPTRGPA